MDKASLRKQAKASLQSLPDDCHGRDQACCERAGKLIEAMEASVLAAFVAIRHEPDLRSLQDSWLASRRPLYLPRYVEESHEYEMVMVEDLERDLVPGRYRIPEPRGNLAGLRPPFDGTAGWIWLVPGLGFDAQGHRLGRGGGYYDRLLSDTTGLKIGVAYDCQIFDAIPCDPHDIGVDFVVTETRILNCGWQSA